MIYINPWLIPVVIAVIAGLFIAMIALFRWLWNMTMPDIFSLKRIAFGQAFRLPVLVALLLLVQLIFIAFATCLFPRVVG